MSVNLPSQPVLLVGDPGYLERLVQNLVSNAVKFTEAEGEVDVSLTVTGNVAELTVHDTGMGIPQEEQGRLFQKFFRSTLATEHAIQGTGLGLQHRALHRRGAPRRGQLRVDSRRGDDVLVHRAAGRGSGRRTPPRGDARCCGTAVPGPAGATPEAPKRHGDSARARR